MKSILEYLIGKNTKIGTPQGYPLNKYFSKEDINIILGNGNEDIIGDYRLIKINNWPYVQESPNQTQGTTQIGDNVWVLNAITANIKDLRTSSKNTQLFIWRMDGRNPIFIEWRRDGEHTIVCNISNLYQTLKQLVDFKEFAKSEKIEGFVDFAKWILDVVEDNDLDFEDLDRFLKMICRDIIFISEIF